MSKNCPACSGNPNIKFVFTFRDIICPVCGVQLKVDEIYRFALVFLLVELIAWFSYIQKYSSESNKAIVWGGLALIILPGVIASKRQISVLGNQNEISSVILNISFFAVFGVVLYLWFGNSII